MACLHSTFLLFLPFYLYSKLWRAFSFLLLFPFAFFLLIFLSTSTALMIFYYMLKWHAFLRKLKKHETKTARFEPRLWETFECVASRNWNFVLKSWLGEKKAQLLQIEAETSFSSLGGERRWHVLLSVVKLAQLWNNPLEILIWRVYKNGKKINFFVQDESISLN